MHGERILKLISGELIKEVNDMAWTYELTQQTSNGELLPLWTVTQWNTDNENFKTETTITQKVKEVCYD